MVVVVAHIEGLEPGRTHAYLTANLNQIALFPQLLDSDTRSPHALLTLHIAQAMHIVAKL